MFVVLPSRVRNGLRCVTQLCKCANKSWYSYNRYMKNSLFEREQNVFTQTKVAQCEASCKLFRFQGEPESQYTKNTVTFRSPSSIIC